MRTTTLEGVGTAILGLIAGHPVFARAARLARQTLGTGVHSADAKRTALSQPDHHRAGTERRHFGAELFYPYLWDELERCHETFPGALRRPSLDAELFDNASASPSSTASRPS
jgi:hypothetical protein